LGQALNGVKSGSFSSPSGWSIGVVVVIAIVGLRMLINRVTVQSTEISAALSPDGAGYAVLLNVPQDAHGAHSARICLRLRYLPLRVNPQSACTSIAYLSGVPAGDRLLGIQLQWDGPSELKIRYREAGAVYLYYPTYTWPGTRSRTSRRYLQGLKPIHVSLVHTE
jgi:hypothetical protein